MKKHLLTLTFLLAAAGMLCAQDADYSQFMNNPIYYNPAYSGISQGMRIGFDYKKQWPNLLNDFKTYNFNADFSIRSFPGSGGVGVIFHKDKAGAGYLETTMAAIAPAVRIRLSENVITQVGITAGFIQKYVDWDRFVFTDQISPRYGNIFESNFTPMSENRVSYPDFSAGAILRYAHTTWRNTNIIGTFGAAVHHVFEPNETFFDYNSPLERKIVIHADMVFQSEAVSQSRSVRYSGGKQFLYHKINPGVFYAKQGSFQTYAFGMNLFIANVLGGLWYRNDDFDFFNASALVLLVGVNGRFNEDLRVKVMYSYDLMINNELLPTGGAHELSIIFELDSFSFFDGGRYVPGGVKTSRGRKITEVLECSPF